jgi:SAM-dependent methyltransferase
MNNYWDKRFRSEGKIWGETPSRTAVYALELFRKNNVKKILVPGSGYGRNTKLFSSAGLDVTGIDISPLACSMADEFDPASRFYNVSALDMSFDNEAYNAVYCFNVLHLFLEEDRHAFIRQCTEKVGANGMLFFTVFSEKEPSYGSGKRVETDTFESKPGRPVHYFTEDDLAKHFKFLKLIETGIIEDPEDHGEGPHTHILRYIYIRNYSTG